jgi:hypothetical protein
MQWNSGCSYVPIVLPLFACVLPADQVAQRRGTARRVPVVSVAGVAALWAVGFPAKSARRTEEPWTVALSKALRHCHEGGQAVSAPLTPVPCTALIVCPTTGAGAAFETETSVSIIEP